MNEEHIFSKTLASEKKIEIRPPKFEVGSIFDSYLANKTHSLQSIYN